jgi:hypothetical protein
MDSKTKVILFVDDAVVPIGEFDTPVNFEFDTRKLIDGLHHLKIVSKDPVGKEGVKVIPFMVRNGPSITIDGLDPHDEVDGILPLMINAYSKGNQTSFMIDGSETPKSVPSWVVAGIIAFVAWGIYYTITSLG